MKIRLTSVYVKNQAHALRFYTEVLGFEKKTDLAFGDDRWLTVTTPGESEDLELVLEPTKFEPAQTFQAALHDADIPLTAFEVDDVDAEFQMLRDKNVEFTLEPTVAGETTIAIFADTCGNLIQLYQRM